MAKRKVQIEMLPQEFYEGESFYKEKIFLKEDNSIGQYYIKFSIEIQKKLNAMGLRIDDNGNIINADGERYNYQF